MKTFDFQKAPVVPAHCLWVSGLLLESGCRASAGLPHLQRVKQVAGDRLVMGEKASGAWGAPDASPLQKLAAGVASRWAGGGGACAETLQTVRGGVSVGRREFLLWDGARLASRGLVAAQTSDGADVASGKTSPAHGRASAGAGEDPTFKPKVIFKPKPEPWADRGSASGGGGERKPSFCMRAVVFSPAPARGV
jgi:hypothetical protein